MARENTADPNQSPFLSVVEAARYLGIRRSTLDHYRCEGRGPRYRKHGWRVFYTREELDRWSKAREYRSTGRIVD